jgi:RHS repeat-associated protein
VIAAEGVPDETRPDVRMWLSVSPINYRGIRYSHTDFLNDWAGQYPTRGVTVMKQFWKRASTALIALLCLLGGTQSLAGFEEITYYHNDALGSPIMATDRTGAVKWRESYAPYGSRLVLESRETTGSPPVPVESSWDEKQWYTGKLEETRVGLQYFGARWYEPELGIFLSPDPVEFQAGNIFSFNRYAYANNNPYKFVDPDGRDPYLVSRPLDGKAGVVANHNFVVSNANFIGDPNATVYSYGRNNMGNTGRVDANTTGFSEDTSASDQTFWRGLATKSDSETQKSVTDINSTDATVDKNANAIMEDSDYAAFAGPFGTNSNSASSAVANRSEGKEVSLPNNGRFSPGASNADKIRFRRD